MSRHTAVVVAVGMMAGAAAASTGARVTVAEWSRSFRPQTVTVRRGDTVEIVNDDGMTVHHAYLDDLNVGYDVGEQEPGGKADIVFDQPGTFTVLCGIHPKMQLVVTVKD